MLLGFLLACSHSRGLRSPIFQHYRGKSRLMNSRNDRDRTVSEVRTRPREKRLTDAQDMTHLASSLILERLEAIQDSLNTMHKDVRELQDDMLRRNTVKKLLIAVGSGMLAAFVWSVEKLISMKS